MKNGNRTFEEVVNSIVKAEEDVDAILNAAKLDRHERPDNRLSAGQKMDLIAWTLGLIGALGFLAFLFLLLTSAM